MRKRNHAVILRLNDEELQLLTNKVNGSGLSRESFLRALIKEKEIRALPQIEFAEVLQELRRIDNNMNQIAVKAHSLKYVDEVAYRSNCTALENAIGQIIRRIY